jgi:hypothetical protein
MKRHGKPFLAFLAGWLATVGAGYWFGGGAVFAGLPSCGDCVFREQFAYVGVYLSDGSGFFNAYKMPTVLTPAPKAFNGPANGASDIWKSPSCNESGASKPRL